MREAVHGANGRTERPILCYVASCDVFGTEVDVDDWMPIEYCPVCGRRLEEADECPTTCHACRAR